LTIRKHDDTVTVFNQISTDQRRSCNVSRSVIWLLF